MTGMSNAWPSTYDSVFTTRDAVHAYLSQPNISLSGKDDCNYRHNVFGNLDCWDSCGQAEYTFSDRFSLWECALVPNITIQSHSGKLSQTDQTILEENNVDPNLSKARNVTLTVSTCIEGYCNALDRCRKQNPPACSVAALTIGDSMLDTDAMNSCIQSICASHPSPLANPDFAGIGIIVSYLLGVGLSIMSALLLTFLSFSETVNGEPLLLNRAKCEVRISAPQRLYDALLAALVEFLKAQCFLAMASSIAATIWFQTHDISLLDGLALMTICNIGIFSVTFTYYILAVFNYTRKSWFIYLLALCTWTLSFYAAFSIQTEYTQIRNMPSYDNYLAVASYVKFPNACAEWPASNICPEKAVQDLEPGYSLYSSLYLPLVLGLTIWQFSCLSFISIRTPKRYPQLSLAIMHVVAVSLLVAPFFFLVKCLIKLFALQSIDATWGFGQIVALTAWVPFLVALVNNYLEGVDEAHTKQLPSSYSAMAIV